MSVSVPAPGVGVSVTSPPAKSASVARSTLYVSPVIGVHVMVIGPPLLGETCTPVGAAAEMPEPTVISMWVLLSPRVTRMSATPLVLGA